MSISKINSSFSKPLQKVGLSSLIRPMMESADLDEIFDRTDEPFGNGSLHTRSAKWVVSQLLPQVKWLDKGRVCEGVGWTCRPSSPLESSLNDLALKDPVVSPS